MLYVAFIGSVILDLWIALSLCYFIARNRTGFKSCVIGPDLTFLVLIFAVGRTIPFSS